jgi:hypothetical protein
MIVLGASETSGYPSDADILAPPPKPPRSLNPIALANLRPGVRWVLRDTGTPHSLTIDTQVTRIQTVREARIVAVATQINGRSSGDRLYRVGPLGLDLLGYGENGKVTLDPPLPLLQAPVCPGDFRLWQGGFHSGKSFIPAAAVIRFAGPDVVHTVAGNLVCYRIDLALFKDPHLRPSRTIMWFAPNIGIVEEHVENGDRTLDYELVSFRKPHAVKPSKTGAPRR